MNHQYSQIGIKSHTAHWALGRLDFESKDTHTHMHRHTHTQSDDRWKDIEIKRACKTRKQGNSRWREDDREHVEDDTVPCILGILGYWTRTDQQTDQRTHCVSQRESTSIMKDGWCQPVLRCGNRCDIHTERREMGFLSPHRHLRGSWISDCAAVGSGWSDWTIPNKWRARFLYLLSVLF